MISEKSGVIIFDLDDTLVDRERIYVKAQITMLNILKKYGVLIEPKKELQRLREVDIELIKRHHGKHMYDYRELALALWLMYNGRKKEEAIDLSFKAFKEGRNIEGMDVASKASEAHNRILRRIPEIFDDVYDALRYLKTKYVLILLSEGDENLQRSVIRHYGFDKIFDYIMIRETKGMEDFKEAKNIGIQLLEKQGGRCERVVFIGDRISRDIRPGNVIGAETVWIPGPYFPGTPEAPLDKPTYQISKLREIEEIL